MRLFSTSAIHLAVMLHDTVEARFRRHINTLISQPRNNLVRRQAGIFRTIHDLNNRCSLFMRQFMLWLWPYRPGPSVRRGMPPTLVRSQRNPQRLAGFEPSGTRCYGLLNQRPRPQSVFNRNQSPSPSPQIAFAFFLRMIRAAASASAASFLFSSRSNSLIRRADSFSFSFWC